jgi:hypothetical protein
MTRVKIKQQNPPNAMGSRKPEKDVKTIHGTLAAIVISTKNKSMEIPRITITKRSRAPGENLRKVRPPFNALELRKVARVAKE